MSPMSEDLADSMSRLRLDDSFLYSPNFAAKLLKMFKNDPNLASLLSSEKVKPPKTPQSRARNHETAAPRLVPIQRLPPGLLADIFKEYLKDPMSFLAQEECPFSFMHRPSKNLLYFVRPFVLILSQVCSSWRRVVHGTSSLWTSLELKVYKRFPDRKVFGDWIRRSGSLPLTFKMEFVGAKQETVPDTYFDSLADACTRWQVIELEIFHHYYEPLLRRKDLRFPLLESIRFGGFFIPYEERSFQLLKHAPRLTRLEISPIIAKRGGELSAYVKDVIPILSQITYLRLNGVSGDPDDYLTILRSCDNLEFCAFSLPDYPDRRRRSGSRTIVELPHLHTLGIEFSCDEGAPEFFDSLKLPRLKKLGVIHEFVPTDERDLFEQLEMLENRHSPIFHLIQLQQRSQFELDYLTFRTITSMTSSELLRFLKVVPGVGDLRIQDCMLDMQELCHGLLAGKDKQVVLLPKLEALTIAQTHVMDGVMELRDELMSESESEGGISVFDVVCSRWDPWRYGRANEWKDSWDFTRLERLYITKQIIDKQPIGEWVRLEGLDRRGFEVNILESFGPGSF
ncbi:hypothetical protein VKT23_010941 [Stygiomarasmius scandens]|uniref:F-box domain-containing protein n=1 Tax=Marasmiellus scandens TaxID=2682957 RepID=A0ABR1JDB0_9AGAR